MNRFFIILYACILILTGCSFKTITLVDEGKRDISTENTVEGDISEGNIETKEIALSYINAENDMYDDKSRYNAITFFTDSDNSVNESIVELYLVERGMYDETPDGVIYHGKYELAKYYIDDDSERISFILHMWNFDSASPIHIATSCLTVNIDDFKREGYIAYDYDESKKTSNEYLYSNDGSLEAHIVYEHTPNFPFITIMEQNEYVEGDMRTELLNRSQKLWLYRDLIEEDSVGTVVKYVGDPFYQVDCGDILSFNYNEYNKIDEINGFITNEEFYGEKYSLRVMFDYGDNRILDNYTYNRPGVLYGTSDSTGEVLYDDKERMIYNDFYVTHGSMYKFYFYEESERRPWAIITFDSMPYGGWEQNGIQYMHGNYTSTYLFMDEQNFME